MRLIIVIISYVIMRIAAFVRLKFVEFKATKIKTGGVKLE